MIGDKFCNDGVGAYHDGSTATNEDPRMKECCEGSYLGEIGIAGSNNKYKLREAKHSYHA